MAGGEVDPRLAAIASQTLSLEGLRATDEEVALVEMLHAILGPRLEELANCDISALAAEPDLDPGRGPRTP
jgi:hypothetical protein